MIDLFYTKNNKVKEVKKAALSGLLTKSSISKNTVLPQSAVCINSE